MNLFHCSGLTSFFWLKLSDQLLLSLYGLFISSSIMHFLLFIEFHLLLIFSRSLYIRLSRIFVINLGLKLEQSFMNLDFTKIKGLIRCSLHSF